MPEDYTHSRSRKQWTNRTEGILKNIIDKLWESTTIPSSLINVPPPYVSQFILTADVNHFDFVKNVGGTGSTLIMAESIANWAGTVNLSVSHNLCSGASASLGKTQLVLDEQHPVEATRLTITIPANCPVGSYTVTVTGSGDSITRTVPITVDVGAGIPPPGKECVDDAQCQQLYGPDYYCVDGECRKECGEYALGCNSDRCPQGQKCLWNQQKGICACYTPDFDISCPGTIQIYRNMQGSFTGAISISSRYGFAGTVTLLTQDKCQPECLKCASAVLKYDSQSGNIIPVPLGAGETKTVTLELKVFTGCPSLLTYYVEITASGGGKTKRCVVAIEVTAQSGGGIIYIRPKWSKVGYSGPFTMYREFYEGSYPSGLCSSPGPPLYRWINNGCRKKFDEHTFYQPAGGRPECYSLAILAGRKWIYYHEAPQSGTPNPEFEWEYICYDGWPPNWGCTHYGQWYADSDIGCGGADCTPPTGQCTQEAGTCPE